MDYRPPADQGLQLLYQDEHIIAVDKPAGLLAVPGKGPQHLDSLSWRVQQRYPSALVVHRLDMATSGIMLLALNKAMQRALSKLFRERLIEKCYIAEVAGELLPLQGEIDLPLITDWPNRPRQMVDLQQGKPALTRFRRLGYDETRDTSRVELSPVTGRSHQLRVHMQALGHAIVGDRLYADTIWCAVSPRLLLHATNLRLQHPVSGQAIEIHSTPPF